MTTTCALTAYNAHALAQGWSSHVDATLSFDDAGLRRFLALWRAQAATGLPHREAFTHRILKDHLTDVSIFERLAEGRWRARLVGRRVEDIYGKVTGRVVADIFPPAAAARLHAAMELPLKVGGAVRMIARTEVASKDFFSAEYCSVPLQGAMVMSCSRFNAVPWNDYLPAMLSRLAEPVAVSA